MDSWAWLHTFWPIFRAFWSWPLHASIHMLFSSPDWQPVADSTHKEGFCSWFLCMRVNLNSLHAPQKSQFWKAGVSTLACAFRMRFCDYRSSTTAMDLMHAYAWSYFEFIYLLRVLSFALTTCMLWREELFWRRRPSFLLRQFLLQLYCCMRSKASWRASAKDYVQFSKLKIFSFQSWELILVFGLQWHTQSAFLLQQFLTCLLPTLCVATTLYTGIFCSSFIIACNHGFLTARG